MPGGELVAAPGSPGEAADHLSRGCLPLGVGASTQSPREARLSSCVLWVPSRVACSPGCVISHAR